jgi:hypothetical protein
VNRWLREISEIKHHARTSRSDGVVLATLLQATRGFLLIVFNWYIFVEFDRIRSIPGLDVMAILPPSIYYLIGFMDILMVKWLWGRKLNGWRYGIATSMLVLLLTPVTFSFLIYVESFTLGLYIIIDLFTVGEIVALVTPSARRYIK